MPPPQKPATKWHAICYESLIKAINRSDVVINILDFNQRQYQSGSKISNFNFESNEGDQHDEPRVPHKGRHMGHTPDILPALLRGKTQIAIEAAPDIVPVQPVT